MAELGIILASAMIAIGIVASVARSSSRARSGAKVPWRFTVGDLIEATVLLDVFIALVVQVAPGRRRDVEERLAQVCRSRLTQIGLAMKAYRQAYGVNVPMVVNGPDGKPWHSWRVLLLPYLNDPEAQRIYKAYDFSKPWDEQDGYKLLWQYDPHRRRPQGVCCPKTRHHIYIDAYVGFPASPGQATSESQPSPAISDFWVIEAQSKFLSWYAPIDLESTPSPQLSVGGRPYNPTVHVDLQSHVLTPDGQVRAIRGLNEIWSALVSGDPTSALVPVKSAPTRQLDVVYATTPILIMSATIGGLRRRRLKNAMRVTLLILAAVVVCVAWLALARRDVTIMRVAPLAVLVTTAIVGRMPWIGFMVLLFCILLPADHDSLVTHGRSYLWEIIPVIIVVLAVSVFIAACISFGRSRGIAQFAYIACAMLLMLATVPTAHDIAIIDSWTR